MNKYQSFYLEDLINLIRKVALDFMLCPEIVGDASESETARMALYNEGIRSMSEGLILELKSQAQDDAEGGTEE